MGKRWKLTVHGKREIDVGRDERACLILYYIWGDLCDTKESWREGAERKGLAPTHKLCTIQQEIHRNK